MKSVYACQTLWDSVQRTSIDLRRRGASRSHCLLVCLSFTQFERWGNDSRCRTFELFPQHTTGFVVSEKYRTRLHTPLAVSHRALHLLADVEHLFSTEARLDVSLCFVSISPILSFPPFALLTLTLTTFCTILVRFVCMISLYRCRPALIRAVDLHVYGFYRGLARISISVMAAKSS